MKPVYYNENEPYRVEWLKNLIAAKLLPKGEVDGRSIGEVGPWDLRGFVQCHFFAGIGGWPYALQLAGWPEDREVWTGSCPCQPFSIAGKRRGNADRRHLWPDFCWLIGERKPAIVFGEQVASKDGREWLSGVRVDLEELGYEVGAADLCAAGVGAPHIRQRLWWVADSECAERGPRSFRQADNIDEVQARPQGAGGTRERGKSSWVADCKLKGLERREVESTRKEREAVERSGDVGGLGHPEYSKRRAELEENQDSYRGDGFGRASCSSRMGDPTYNNEQGKGKHQKIVRRKVPSRGSSMWSNFTAIPCLDGKQRRIEPGICPLAHGVPARVGKLRAYGNAIVPQAAAEFIKAYLDCAP